MSLKYKIVKERRGYVDDVVYLKAKPNEWACHVDLEIRVKPKSYIADLWCGPSIERISWSAGARTWTVADARKFFRAGLKLLDVAEKELKKAKRVTKREARG